MKMEIKETEHYNGNSVSVMPMPNEETLTDLSHLYEEGSVRSGADAESVVREEHRHKRLFAGAVTVAIGIVVFVLGLALLIQSGAQALATGDEMVFLSRFSAIVAFVGVFIGIMGAGILYKARHMM